MHSKQSTRWWRPRVIRVTSDFKYLGPLITSAGDSNEEINPRTVQTKTATRQLNGVLYGVPELQTVLRCINHNREHKLILDRIVEGK